MTNLLDDIDVPKTQSKATLSKKATNLIGRKPTRRGKRKKKTKTAKWQKEFNIAMKEQTNLKQQIAEHWKEANRLIEKE